MMDYTIKRSKKSKYIHLRIEPTGEIVLTLPQFVAAKHGHDFIIEKKEWLKKKLSAIKFSDSNYKFETGEFFPLLNEKLKLLLINKERTNPKVSFDDRYLVVFANQKMLENKGLLKEVITKAYKREFKKIIQRKVEYFNDYYKFNYLRIAVKSNRSNWGSCSSRGNLNFNWKLVLAPEKILDYVVVHEICHLKEQNHSKRFWDLVSEQYSDFAVAKNWLKENGGQLAI